MAKQELQFEEALARLEAVVAKLEGGNVTLAESLSCYEEGMALIRLCTERLAEAEARVLAVKETGEGVTTVPFAGGEG